MVEAKQTVSEFEKTKCMVFHTPGRQLQYPSLFMNDCSIEIVNEFNFLGIVFDKSLTWKCHVNAVCKKVSKAIGILNKLKNYLPSHALKTIHNSLVLPHFNYGLLLWGSRSNKVFPIQKKVIRILTNSKYNAHTSGLFKQLNILRISDMYTLNLYKLCYKFCNGLIPSHFEKLLYNPSDQDHPYSTRYHDQFRIPRVRHEFAKRRMSYQFPSALNTMSPAIKEKISTHCFIGFKKYAKLFFLQTYNEFCDIANCYICHGGL
jgi:hypothetical protein